MKSICPSWARHKYQVHFARCQGAYRWLGERLEIGSSIRLGRNREESSKSLWLLVTWLRPQFSNSACHPNASSSKFLSGLSENSSLIPSKTDIAIFTFLGSRACLLSRSTLRSSETHLRTQRPATYTDYNPSLDLYLHDGADTVISSCVGTSTWICHPTSHSEDSQKPFLLPP